MLSTILLAMALIVVWTAVSNNNNSHGEVTTNLRQSKTTHGRILAYYDDDGEGEVGLADDLEEEFDDDLTEDDLEDDDFVDDDFVDDDGEEEEEDDDYYEDDEMGEELVAEEADDYYEERA